MKIFIQNDPYIFDILKFTIAFVCQNKNISFQFVDEDKDADLLVKFSEDSHFALSKEFYEKIGKKIFNHEAHLKDDYFIRNQSGKIDRLATIFYLLNCIQEYDYPTDQLDHYGRFPYEASLQFKYGIIERNVVQEIIDDFFENHPVLSKEKHSSQKSQVFLSHDIDFVYDHTKGELKNALLSLQPLKASIYATALVTKKSMHLDIKEFNKLHQSYNRKSHYFWIAKNQQRDSKIKNGDYHFNSPFIQESINTSSQLGSINGLHKSTNDSSIQEEASLFKQDIIHNRYHYLKYTLPEAWSHLATSKIKYDHSLAFGSQMGFRNNYGNAFQPFNFVTKKAYPFTVIPFQIMDSTFMHYQKMKFPEIKNRIENFIETHQKNCLLSVIWHNTSLTSGKYKPYRQLYTELLALLSSLDLKDIQFPEAQKP